MNTEGYRWLYSTFLAQFTHIIKGSFNEFFLVWIFDRKLFGHSGHVLIGHSYQSEVDFSACRLRDLTLVGSVSRTVVFSKLKVLSFQFKVSCYHSKSLLLFDLDHYASLYFSL